MILFLALLAVFFIVATITPFFRRDEWWIRIFDFPRSQIAIGGALVAFSYLFVRNPALPSLDLVFGLLMLCVIYQSCRMYPYTPMASCQVHDAETGSSPDATFTLLIANVLMSNRNAEGFLQIAGKSNPDLILCVETDAWWEKNLRALEKTYTCTVKKPLENTYGMLLYSRLPLIEPEIRCLMEEDIPSIKTSFRLASGVVVQFYGMHPKPPYPEEDKDTTERDAELLLVGKEVKGLDKPAVVAGDMNDVAWSHTTHLFQKISGLLDPRIGRGMYNSFHAKYPFLRYPLDHVFHSDHFKLVSMSRLPYYGSDHFPICIELHYDPSAEAQQEEPEADQEEQEEAAEKVAEGIAKSDL